MTKGSEHDLIVQRSEPSLQSVMQANEIEGGEDA